MNRIIPEPSVIRLCLMYRLMERLENNGVKTVFSPDIGENLGITAHTIRKDISFLGEIGNTAAGYDVAKLKDHIHGNLGLDKKRFACIAGLGKLGQALLNYRQFLDGDYRVIAGFDSDINNLEMLRTSVPLYPSYRMTEIVKDMGIELAVIAVPVQAAQEVANRLIAGGVKGIINFAQVNVKSKSGQVLIRNIDLYGELRILSALLNLKETASLKKVNGPDPGKED
ncbi:MAG: redox-sensing transcriptional repressor Rex [Spirochaetales bacterium]|nr:redox-sensing transcriptional repressor Rex [Spirochaetales bacterium]